MNNYIFPLNLTAAQVMDAQDNVTNYIERYEKCPVTKNPLRKDNSYALFAMTTHKRNGKEYCVLAAIVHKSIPEGDLNFVSSAIKGAMPPQGMTVNRIEAIPAERLWEEQL